MKLKKFLEDVSEEEWIDVTEQSTQNYRNYIGRAPKRLINGPVLNYDVHEVKEPIEARGITILRVLVSWKIPKKKVEI